MVDSRIQAKPGPLAEEADILSSKVRFYFPQGFLQPVAYTPGGRHLLFGESKEIDRPRFIARLKPEQRRVP